MKKKSRIGSVVLNIILIAMTLTFIIPFMYVISVSISNEDKLIQEGYKLIPSIIDFSAYKFSFANPQKLIWAYKTTIIESFAATILSLIVTSLLAYPLSRRNYSYRKALAFYVYFTTLFSGGLVPTYILNTQYLHLGNTIWIYILPYLISAFNVIIVRTSFQALPEALIESAKIDGCSEIGILFKIVLPLSKPVLATIGLMTLLGRWNEWSASLLYIRDEKLYTLQYLLQRILREVEYINTMADKLPNSVSMNTNVPSESMRFAMCVLAAGPMLVVFPFFQKYFARGLTVGSVKG